MRHYEASLDIQIFLDNVRYYEVLLDITRYYEISLDIVIYYDLFLDIVILLLDIMILRYC